MQLLNALRREIALARPGSDQGQFPILDILGNLRDEAAKNGIEAARALCAGAWEKLLRIVEAGQPFSEGDVAWLNELAAQLGAGEIPGAAPAPATQPPPPVAQPAKPVSAAEELPLLLNIPSDADLLREFITESREHLDNIEQGVLVLETQPANAEQLNTIFRAFHTFKGSAGFLNLIPINRLAHILESLLDLARQGRLSITPEITDLILRGRDVLKRFLDEIDAQVSGSKPVAQICIPTAQLKSEVQKAIDACEGKPAPAQVPATPATTPAISIAEFAPPHQPQAAESPAPLTAPPPALPVTEPPVPASAPPPQATEQQVMVKVNTVKLDSLLDLVGEMVIAQSLVAQDMNRLAHLDASFARNMAQLGRITKELQRVSMSMRMTPVRNLFQKMARVVRDIGAKQQKKVQLITDGEDTELDRTVVEVLNDPLLHMIRNSMDHGIESAEARASRGKPAMGTIHLRACHQGGNIVIEIADDGAGLNRERILAKAIERHLATPENRLTDEEIFSFIFAPGFSTAEKITDLSGRGVGLDVVNRNINRLRGRVDISSKAGEGSLFKITLPLTLAIIDALIVKVGNERYIIPTLSVRESFRPQADAISTIQGRAEVVNVRGKLIPLLRLHEVFGISGAVTNPAEGIVIVAQSGTSFQCLLVDGLLHKQEVVIKNLNELMVHKNNALAGAAILGDGRVGLILDVNSLVHQDGQHCLQAA